MTYVYTVLGTTLAIIVAEILGNYGLGDVVKDLFRSAEAKVAALEAKLEKAKAAL
jgi:uncharacterized membrane protein YdjX (TVP38/TMEM64 family)